MEGFRDAVNFCGFYDLGFITCLIPGIIDSKMDTISKFSQIEVLQMGVSWICFNL
jgi:hypothetical protein